MYLGTIIDPPGTAVCTYRVLGKLVIVPRLALSARRAAGATAGAAPTRGYLGRPLANLRCQGPRNKIYKNHKKNYLTRYVANGGG